MAYKNLKRKEETYRRWMANNKERLAKVNRLWRKKNKVAIAKQKQGYYRKNKAKIDTRNRAYFKANKSKAYDRMLRWKCKGWGITVREYRRLLKSPCKICREKSTVLDHDHKDGKVRGALCRKHNMALGLFGDSVELLRSAIRYLLKKRS